jgi:hypothetical protein
MLARPLEGSPQADHERPSLHNPPAIDQAGGLKAVGQQRKAPHLRSRPQACQDHRNEAAHRSLGRQAASGCEGVKAVTGELIGRDIIPELAGSRALGQQVSDEAGEQLSRFSDVLSAMQECRKLGPMVLVRRERIGHQHRFEALAGVTRLIPNLSEMCEVLGDLTFVPGNEDRFDIGEVLVERRTSDARLLGDLGHRHRPQPLLSDQLGGDVERRIAYRAPMRFDRLVPQLRHQRSVRKDQDSLIRQ